MRLGLIIAALGMWIAASAHATPERMTTSQDRIVAATQSHLYVLRDIRDNQGSHYLALLDQHLVEINLDSGEATRFWPLRRVTISNLETDDYLSPGHVSERAGATHAMIGILRDMGAVPMVPEHWSVQDLTLENGAVMRGGVQVLTPFGIRAAGRAQLGILRAAYPPFASEAEYHEPGRIDFYDLYATGDWACEIRPEGTSLYRVHTKILLAKLHCEDAALSGAWSFHIILSETVEN